MAKTILVTGGNGLVGSALRTLEAIYPEYNFVFTCRQEHDLTREEDVKRLFEEQSPDYVIHTAARVGGIGRNLSTPAQQYYANILMNAYVIHYAQKSGVEKLLAFSSVCAFPAGAQSLHEDILHDGEPYPAHYSYAYSKRMVDVQIKAYKQQHGVNYCSVIPGNIFGENDNFNLEDGHVVPSLVHKCYKAKQEGKPLQVWGDGTPYRIGYAFSKDGKSWSMEQSNMTVSESGWDSQMVCYPYVFRHKQELYMLYNGNKHGSEGFGLSVMEK